MKIWYNNGKIEKLIEDTEIITDDFIKGRLPKIKKVDLLKEKISKEAIIDYYIKQNHNFEETYRWLNISRNELKILINYYNICKSKSLIMDKVRNKRTHESYIEGGKKSSETQKKYWNSKSTEDLEIWKIKCRDAQLKMSGEQKFKKLDKYFKTMSAKSSEEITQINNRRSISCRKTWSNPELIEKQHQTLLKNNESRKSQFKSIGEEKLYYFLIESYPNLKYNSKIDERYPYYCDFYIPELDLFIEYQGHPSHGRYPYKKSSKYSKDFCKKYKDNWLNTYTIRDVEKYQCAVNNQLNYIRIYPRASLSDNINLNPIKFKELLITLYTIQK